MKRIIFATGNEVKLRLATEAAARYRIEVLGKPLEIDEIQSEDAEEVVRDKAAKAFAIIKRPVIVSDDSWSIAALKGFPGVYMHSINAWFAPEDFLRLMLGVKDRKVVLKQTVVYRDANRQKLFVKEISGRMLEAVRGKAPDSPNHTVMTMDGDDGLSIAEAYSQSGLGKRSASRIWQEFFEWYSRL